MIPSLFTGEYYYLRQMAPIILYILYIQFKEEDNLIINTGIFAGLLTIGMITAYSFTGFLLKIPFLKLIPLKWNYQGLLTWGTFFLVYYHIALRSNLNKLTSFTLTTLAAVGGGWLYEIPFVHSPIIFIPRLNIQVICLLLLAYELRKMGFKPNKLIYTTLTLLTAYSIHLFYNISLLENISVLRAPYTWFMRVPTCLFLISLLGGIKN